MKRPESTSGGVAITTPATDEITDTGSDSSQLVSVPRQRQLLIAGMAVHAVGVEILTILPAFVHGLVEHMGFSEVQAGRIASLENLGMAVSTVSLTLLWRHIHWRRACIVGLIVLGLANILSIWGHSYPLMLAMRFASGLGAGVSIVLSYAVIGLTLRKERNFGLLVFSSLLFGAAMFAIIPLSVRVGGMTIVFLLLGGLPLLSLALARYFPDMRGKETAAQSAGLAASLKVSALAGVALYAVAIGALWAYFFRIGASAGLPEDVLSRSFSLSQFCAIGGSFLAAALAHRLRLSWALTLGIAGLVFPLVGILDRPSALIFAITICLFNGFWNFFHPYVLAAFAIFGENSRMVVYASPLLMIGLSAGPALASMTLGENSFTRIIVGSAILLVLSLLLMLPAAIKSVQTIAEGRRLKEGAAMP